MRPIFRLTFLALVLAAATASAQQRPPVRQLGAVTARSAEKFGTVLNVRSLENGSVLVNEPTARRIVMLDPALASVTVIADSTSATANAYSGRFGQLVAYRGDSSIFIDPTSSSMLVIDASGKIARVMAIPRAEDAMSLGMAGNPVFDGRRLVYRGGLGFRMGGAGGMRIVERGAGGAGPAPFTLPEPPDSAVIVAIDIATRQIDTVGFIRIPKQKFEMQQDENGNRRIQSTLNPLPIVDDWAVLPDGTVAFVRGRDYHVEWVSRDGVKTAGAKIPFNWQRMTDEDKIAFLDSLKAARERLGPNAPVPMGTGQIQAAPATTMVFTQTRTAGDGAPSTTQTTTGGPGNSQVQYVPASELPDYKPAFFAGSTRSDSEGNLWVRTIPTEALAGGPVYDVINRKGELIDRVQIPENRTIMGFGPGGTVYLLHGDGRTGTLERASIR